MRNLERVSGCSLCALFENCQNCCSYIFGRSAFDISALRPVFRFRVFAVSLSSSTDAGAVHLLHNTPLPPFSRPFQFIDDPISYSTLLQSSPMVCLATLSVCRLFCGVRDSRMNVHIGHCWSDII
jgi:hypothetical protein